MEPHEFNHWLAQTQRSADKWTEDRITRLNGRGALYYTGGEDGVYIRVTQDGILEAGIYEGAYPHIGEALFQPMVHRNFGTYNKAFEKGLELGGLQFLIDMVTSDPAEDPTRYEVGQPEFSAGNRTFATPPVSPDETGIFYALEPDQGFTMGGM